MKKKFSIPSYANMMQPGTLSMQELAELQLRMKDHVDAIVDAPTEDEVESALKALGEMSDGNGTGLLEQDGHEEGDSEGDSDD